MQRGIHAVQEFEVVEEGLAEAHAELDRADMLAVVQDRDHAARAETGNAAFKTVHRFLCCIGGDHGMTERGQVVAEFFGLVHAQERGRRRRVELELFDAIILAQMLIARYEQAAQTLAVAIGEFFLHHRDARHQRAHGLRSAAFGSNGIVDGLEVSVERAALRFTDQVLHIGQVDERQHAGDDGDCDSHGQHDLGPEA